MFIERGPIKAIERKIIARKMGRHPVQKNTDSLFVKKIYEILKILQAFHNGW